MIKHIATVGVYVDNQQKAITFWTEKAGFQVFRNQPMTPDASWVEVGPEGAQSALVLYPKAMMPNWEELKPSIVFHVEDIQQTYEAMKSRGVHFLEEPNPQPWGTYCRFQDEDGNEFLMKG
ncbi:MAG: Glyoxalase/bleomycin resistance protein/dioxygenase [Paenibacillus sp.]|jgi:predicted enzyme related to lactoylglutathione lyase|nr:Glyoxalase/bleomycin resistance protein/dioxygenase [Paenibacillus sp.]